MLLCVILLRQKWREERWSINHQFIVTNTVLLLYTLNCFKDYIKRYIHISIRFGFGLTQVDEMNSGIQYMLSVQHNLYHACWCSGDFRSQCISRHGIDPQSRNIPCPVPEELIDYHLLLKCSYECAVQTMLTKVDIWYIKAVRFSLIFTPPWEVYDCLIIMKRCPE